MVRLANPLHTEWILEAIQKIKRQKQCPSEERICHAVSASRGLCRSAVLQQLELSVRDGAVLKVTKKGCSSYKDADTPRQMGALQPGAVMSWASSDLRQFDWNTALRRAIESLGDPQGSSLKNIERYLREQDDLSVVVGSPLFRRRLRLAAKRAVNSGRLEKAGRVYRVSCVGAGAPSRCSSMPPCLPQVTLLAHEKDQPRADPIPICSFCFGTKESNRASVPEELLSCADCGSSGHPSCLKFSPELCANVKVLHWQCLDCKTCSFCHIRDKDADRMVFCDSCDRGFHMDCCDPPLARIPKGLWICQVCQPKKRGRRLLQRRVAQIMRRYARPRGLPRRRHPPPPDHRSRGKVADPSQPQGLGGTDTQALPSPPMSADSPLSSSSQSSGPSPVALPRRGQLKGLFDGLSHIYATQGPARRKSLPSYALPTPTSGWGLRWERPFKAAAGFKRIASIRRCGDRGSEAWRGAGVMAEDVQLFQRVQDLSSQKTDSLCGPHSGRCPAYIEIGNYEIQTWYSSAYPREYSRLRKLYICEFCLMYAKSRAVLHRHAEKHSCFRPPADEIYRKDELSVFEVDGKVSKVFCQNLCLLAKLFLEHKTLYYDVEPFLFYVLTRNDAKGCHLVGYFSKEKHCQQRYNVSCIMILPQFQRQGFGHFLIDFSYLLSRCEGQPGSPEKPLSHLGRLSYLAYWRSVILERLQRHLAPALSIRGLSKATGICPHDIAATLQELRMLEVRAGRYVIVRRERLIREHVERLRRKPRQHTLHSEYLRWLTSRGRQAQAERLDQGTSQEEEDEEEASWASLTKDRSRNPPQGFLKGLAQKDILASEGKEDHAHTLGHYLDCNPELDQMLDHTQAVRKKKMPVLNRKWGHWRKRINNSVTTETILETTEVLNEPLDHSEEGSPARMGRDGPGLSHPSGWRRLMDNEENHRHLGDNIVMTTATSAGGRTRATRRKRGWPKGVKRGPSTRKRETKRKAGFTLDLYTPPETPMEAVHHAVSAKARLGAGEGGGLISMTEFIQGLLPDLPGLSSDKPDSLEVSSCEGGVADQSGVGEEEEGTVPIEDRDADDEDEGHAYPTESEAGGMVAGESEEPFQWSKDVLDEPPVMDGVFQGDVCPYESRPASQTKGDGQHELPEADAETACAVRSLMGVAMLDGGFQDCDEMRETCRDPEGYTVLEQSPYVAIFEDYTQSEHSSPLSSIQSQPSRSVGSPSMVLLEGGYSLRGLEASPVLDLPSVVDSGFSDLGSIESTAESYENPGSYDSARGGSLCIAASSQSGCSYSGPSSYALSQQMVPMAQCHTDSPQSCRISSPQGCTVPGAFAKVHEGLGPGLFECSTTCYPPPTASFSLAKLQQLTNTLVESLPMSLGHPASHPLTVLPSASLPLHTIPGTLPPKLTPPPMMMRHNAGAPSLQRTRMQMEPAKGHVAMHTESARHSQQQVYGLRPPVQAPTQGLAVPRMNVGLNITPPSAYSVSSINMNVSVNMNMSMNIAPIDQAMNGYHVTQPIMTTNYQGNHAYLNQPPQCSVQLGMMGTQPYPGQHVQTLPHSNVMYTPAGHHGYVNGRLQKQSVSNTYMRR